MRRTLSFNVLLIIYYNVVKVVVGNANRNAFALAVSRCVNSLIRNDKQVSDNLVGDNDIKVSQPNDTNPDRNESNVDAVASIIQIINLLSTCWTLFNNQEVVRFVYFVLLLCNL